MADMGLGRVPLLARVEPHRARRRGVLHGRARALPADVRGLSRARDPPRRHLPPLHDPAVAHRARRVGGARRPRALRPLRRTVDGVPGRPHRMGLHHQRAQRRRGHGVLPGRVPARGQGRLRPLRRRERGDGARPPPGRRRPARRSGGLPGRPHALHGGDHGHRGRGVAARRRRGDAREHLSARHRGRRLRRGAVLHPHALRPGRAGAQRPRRPARPRWATSAGPRRSSTRCGGRPR